MKIDLSTRSFILLACIGQMILIEQLISNPGDISVFEGLIFQSIIALLVILKFFIKNHKDER